MAVVWPRAPGYRSALSRRVLSALRVCVRPASGASPGAARSVAGVLESYGALEQRLSQGLDEEGEHWGRKPPSLGRTNVVRWRSDARWGRKPPPGPPPFGHWVALGPELGQENTYWGRLTPIGAG